MKDLNKIHDCLYEMPRTFRPDMKVPGRIYASEELLSSMDSAVFSQLANVCTLPGIVKYALCMPDGHSGYGFPIGGAAAMDPDRGVISPGGIGFDINCGVRLMVTDLSVEQVRPRIKEIVDALFNSVPAGVGGGGIVSLSDNRFDEAMVKGSCWAIENGYGLNEDLDYTEEGGCVAGADPSRISARARERGRGQVGSLGSGNHYLEIQYVAEGDIFDRERARDFGITGTGQVAVMIHSGSRGFGHQVATDYLQRFIRVMKEKYNLSVPDRELACAPFYSEDGQDYYGAMNCAINIAFLNRQLIMHRAREVLTDIFSGDGGGPAMRLVYDVCHNTAKLERQQVDGKDRPLLVHRKGATRSFAPGMKDVPDRYQKTGQPVIIGGSMQNPSYLLAGVASGADAFFTTAHGSGRTMSRMKAKKQFNGRELQKSMKQRGIYVQTSSFSGLAEEAGAAYKNIDLVIDATARAGLNIPVARFTPVGNIKG
ncbi:MAG TPA: RtcB family protein [Spirochaetota bacterium]|nr:RtcB family protein [Spirochaetota bacterium]HPI91255.1 RtcB family protein [Spirochaetota bacterium]